ncbi:Aste57867_13810 [Aphanomyces stellatus]|uniref:Aste57867_13810 protein n=1 Tax=Aphanomyces stellatus TaxID=120398 RepID=A0A485L190_9STRA|nr:hypothetical protein As57867_013760 [Aphanomyces stellatus]VFT90642.1 Aste57867_13810 [Aphanomyces stellatus]
MIKKCLQESKLAIAVVVLVLARCVDRVINARVTYDYPQYLWYLANIISPVAFLFICWPVVWYKLSFTDDITPAMKAVPHYKYVIMSFLDMASSLLSTVPIPHIGGNLSNVLGQLGLPFTMILSRVLLQTRYKMAHVVGAIMVFYGALVCMIPIFRGEEALNSPDPAPLWILLYVLSCVPSSGANVYKEISLKDVDLDIWYANAWISVYQVVWGLLTMWTIRLPAFSDPPVEWADFPSYVASAHKCFFGQPTTFNGVASACDGAIFVTYLQYLLFNVIFNNVNGTSMMYIFREGSSVMFVISSAVCLPLTDILYMIPALAGPLAKQKFTIFDGFALFIILLGMFVYHSEKEERVTADHTFEPKSPAVYKSPSVRGIELRRKLPASRSGMKAVAGYGTVRSTDSDRGVGNAV